MQLYSAAQRKDNNIQTQAHKKVLAQFLIQLTAKESQSKFYSSFVLIPLFSLELAHTLVTEWVKWQHRFAPALNEAPPMPSERSVNPEERPKFEQNLDYETHSEKSPPPGEVVTGRHI